MKYMKLSVTVLCLLQASSPVHASANWYDSIKKFTQEQKEKIQANKKVIGAVVGSTAAGIMAGVIFGLVYLKRRSIFHRPSRQATQEYKQCCNDVIAIFYLDAQERKTFEDHKKAIFAEPLATICKEYNLQGEFGDYYLIDRAIKDKNLEVGEITKVVGRLRPGEVRKLLYLVIVEAYKKVKKADVTFSYEIFQQTLEFLSSHEQVHEKHKSLNLIRRNLLIRSLALQPKDVLQDILLQASNNDKKPDAVTAEIKETDNFIELLYTHLA